MRRGAPRADRQSREQRDGRGAARRAQARADALTRAAARTASAQQAVQHQKGSAAHLLRSRAAQSAVVSDQPHVPLLDAYYAYEDLHSPKSSYF